MIDFRSLKERFRSLKERNDFIKNSLLRARIQVVLNGALANFTGRIGPFDVIYGGYWLIKGLVPIDLATKLYEDPEGRFSIRVNGDCGKPHPNEFACWYDSNNKCIIVDPDGSIEKLGREKYAKVADDFTYAKAIEHVKDKKLCIDGYHIDTQSGLRVFSDFVREYYKL